MFSVESVFYLVKMMLILSVAGKTVQDEVDGVKGTSAVGFNTRTLLVLKGKTSPETRLSNEELQVPGQGLFVCFFYTA